MKFKRLIISIIGFSLITTGCVSIEYPYAHDKAFPASDQCIVLGDAAYAGHINFILGFFAFGGVRYTDLLYAARQKYGHVDDVINVSVDKSWAGIIGLLSIQTITMRGIAIVYTETLPAAKRAAPPAPAPTGGAE